MSALGRGVLVLILALGLAATPAASAAPRHACTSPIPTETFDISLEPRRDSYALGETAVVDVVVTDAFTGLPQEGVDAGVFIAGKRDRFGADHGSTDAAGRLELKFPLSTRWAEPGWAEAHAYAWDIFISPALCVYLWGYERFSKLFRITK